MRLNAEDNLLLNLQEWQRLVNRVAELAESKNIIITNHYLDGIHDTLLKYTNMSRDYIPSDKTVGYYMTGIAYCAKSLLRGSQNEVPMDEPITLSRIIDLLEAYVINDATFDYVEEDNYVSITKVTLKPDQTEFVCPGYIKNKPVKIISTGWSQDIKDTLVSLKFEEGAFEIGANVFADCHNVVNLDLADTITTIRQGAFNELDLTDLYIPKGVTLIEDNAFSGMEHLLTITVDDANSEYYSKNNCLIGKKSQSARTLLLGSYNSIIPQGDEDNITYIAPSAFEDYQHIVERDGVYHIFKGVQIPDRVTSIGAYAFDSARYLEEINIPSNCCFIGAGAFKNMCVGDQSIDTNKSANPITKIVLPSGITSISRETFRGCTSLKQVVLSDYCATIEAHAFNNCSNLEWIYIPANCTKIEDYAFANINNQTCIYYGGTAADWGNIEISAVGNSNFNNLTIYYYLDSVPDNTEYLYWRWVDGEPSVWPNYEIAFIRDSSDNETDTYAIMSLRNNNNTNIVIPNSLNGYSVKHIADSAFVNHTEIVSVTIPNSITSIGSQAFQGCINLATCTFSTLVNKIGEKAFAGCPALQQSEGVYYINYWAVDYDIDVATPTLRTNTIGIADKMFQNTDKLSPDLKIPTRVSHIGAGAFWNSNALICEENRVRYVDNWAIGVLEEDGTPSILTLRENTRGIIDKAWSDSTGTFINEVVEFYAPSNLQYIGAEAFAGQTSLNCLNIPQAVSIGENAFLDSHITNATIHTTTLPYLPKYSTTLVYLYLTAGTMPTLKINPLKTLVLGPTIKSFTGQSIYNCSNLQTINVDSDNPLYIAENNIVYDSTLTTLLACVRNSVSSITIPSSVTIIEQYAFYSNKKIESIKFASHTTLLTIKAYAFAYCTNIQSIRIPISVTTISSSAFSQCTSLLDVALPVTLSPNKFFLSCSTIRILATNDTTIIPKQYCGTTPPARITTLIIEEGITEIAKQAFEKAQFKTISIAPTVTKIAEQAFKFCKHVESLSIANSIYRVVDGCLVDITTNTVLFSFGETRIIPDFVTTIGAYAFAYYNNLQTLTVLNSIETIGYGAFYNSNFASEYGTILLPNVKSIAEYAFAYSNCVYISIGLWIQEIKGYAFAYCTSLSAIRIERQTPPTFTNAETQFIGSTSVSIEVFPDEEIKEQYEFSLSASNLDQYLSTFDLIIGKTAAIVSVNSANNEYAPVGLLDPYSYYAILAAYSLYDTVPFLTDEYGCPLIRQQISSAGGESSGYIVRSENTWSVNWSTADLVSKTVEIYHATPRAMGT